MRRSHVPVIIQSTAAPVVEGAHTLRNIPTDPDWASYLWGRVRSLLAREGIKNTKQDTKIFSTSCCEFADADKFEEVAITRSLGVMSALFMVCYFLHV